MLYLPTAVSELVHSSRPQWVAVLRCGGHGILLSAGLHCSSRCSPPHLHTHSHQVRRRGVAEGEVAPPSPCEAPRGSSPGHPEPLSPWTQSNITKITVYQSNYWRTWECTKSMDTQNIFCSNANSLFFFERLKKVILRWSHYFHMGSCLNALTLCCHVTASSSLRLLASSRSAIRAVCSANSAAWEKSMGRIVNGKCWFSEKLRVV